jgi:hypothetical protein
VIQLTFTDGGLSVSLEKAPQVIGLQLQKWMTRVLAHLHAAVNRNIGDGGLLGRRTGNLARALQEVLTVSSDGIVGELFPDPTKVAYGGIQEEGGTVIPSKAHALAIPLEAMLTGNGVARGTAADVRANPSAFGFVSTFIPKGHSVIMGKEAGKGGGVIPLFALKPSVTIPGRHYLAITLLQEWAWIADALEAATGDIVNVLFENGQAASA